MILNEAINNYLATLKLSLSSQADLLKNLDKDHLIKNFSIIGKEELTIISVFYNEELNVIPAYLEFVRLDRIFNIREFIFVQNGSSDKTGSLLAELANYDKRVRIVQVEKNLGYGFGFKSALEACQTDLVLLNHSDSQFDAYAFYTQNFSTILNFDPEEEVILPIRVGRSWYAFFRSLILRITIFAILGVHAKEFNGQPKLFLKSQLGNISTLPNDFAFDLGVVCRLLRSKTKKLCYLYSLELPRFDGKSSWSISFKGQFNLAKQYFLSILNFKRTRR